MRSKAVHLKRITDGVLGAELPAVGGHEGLGFEALSLKEFFVIF